MNSAVEIFDEVHILITEISHLNVKQSIMDILDDVMGNVDNVGVDIQEVKKLKKQLIKFQEWKVEEAEELWKLFKSLEK